SPRTTRSWRCAACTPPTGWTPPDPMNRKAARQRLDHLWERGRAFLGCEVAIMGGAMTWVSERHLVAALSNAGGFAVIASASLSPVLLATQIPATPALPPPPFPL